MKILFAEKCAWRATYAYRHDRLVFSLGVSPPSNGQPPHLFGQVGRRQWRLELTWVYLPWRRAAALRRFGTLRLYRWQSLLWHKVDGRYS